MRDAKLHLPGAVIVACALVTGPVAQAETELSFYLGPQTAPHSRVTGNDPGGVGDIDFRAEWEGRSLEMPPHYGLRVTWWRNERLGFGIDFNHAKVYLSDAQLAATGFSDFQLSHGLNIVTANVMYRWPRPEQRVTPYAGAGLGVSIPHVDIASPGGGATYGYQLTGPAATWIAGLSYALNDRWSVFGEYKGTYSMNEVDLVSGGSLETDIVTNALNIGLSFRF